MFPLIRRLFNLFVRSDAITYGVYPTSADTVAAAAVTVTGNAVVFGAWAQIVSAANNTGDRQIYGFTAENWTGDWVSLTYAEIELGTGAAGAEVVIAQRTVNGSFRFAKPVTVQAGTRIAARALGSLGTVDIKVLTVSGF